MTSRIELPEENTILDDLEEIISGRINRDVFLEELISPK